MTSNLQVAVLSPYPFAKMVNQAQLLHKAGVLECMVTAVPRSRVGLPHEKVMNRLRWSAARRLAGGAVPGADALLVRRLVLDFDRWAERQIGNPSIVNGLSGFATETLIRASSRGAKVFCDRGSWHMLEQQRVLDEEAARIGVQRERSDPFMIERELREYEMVDQIIVPSEPARRSFVRQGVSFDRIVKIPYGVDAKGFAPPTGQHRQPDSVVCVGTIGLRKGQYHLVRAFDQLSARTAELCLVGAVSPGWGRRLGLRKSRVRMTGHVSKAEVVRELGHASIFVLPSVEEGLALVIPQAMACGLAVIATEATGAEEFITDGREGFILKGSPTASGLAERIDVLLSDRERCRAMGAAGRRRVVSLGGWERYGSQVLDAFERARGTSTT